MNDLIPNVRNEKVKGKITLNVCRNFIRFVSI